MRHGGAALLSRRERFFRFANFRSLQVADFKCDLFERGGNSGQRSDVMGVQIAREDLRGNRCGLQAKPCADLLLRLRSDVGKCPNSARYFAHTNLFRRFGETRAMALDLIPPDGEFQTECNGLGVNSVRPPDLKRMLIPKAASFQRPGKLVRALSRSAPKPLDLESLRGIDDVVRS